MDASQLTPTTELEAVNDMLLAIGESPVASLEGTLAPDAQSAQQVLVREARTIQSQGYSWNTDEGFRLSPDINGEIILPANALKVSPTHPYHSYTTRGGKLWDRLNKTFTFTDAVYLDIVSFLDFGDIPEPARRLIYLVALKKFDNRVDGAQGDSQSEAQDVVQAKADLMELECDASRLNVVRDSWSVRRNVIGVTGSR